MAQCSTVAGFSILDRLLQRSDDDFHAVVAEIFHIFRRCGRVGDHGGQLLGLTDGCAGIGVELGVVQCGNDDLRAVDDGFFQHGRLHRAFTQTSGESKSIDNEKIEHDIEISALTEQNEHLMKRFTENVRFKR